jgi:DNA repair exonuclease SbcCD ATPase subunit
MQDIYIDKVKLHNVRNHTDMEMDFPSSNFTVLIGKNGAGKSTIPKSISMALYGDDGAIKGKRLSISEMINRKAKKDLEILLNFRIVENGQTDNYEIQLYQEHKKFKNRFILLKNGIDISGESKTETYKHIEHLLVPRDVYHNIVYFSQQVKDFFTSLTDSQQKEIFDAILSTQEYNVFYKNDTAVMKVQSEKVSKLDSEIMNLGTAIKIKRENTLISLEKSKEDAISHNNQTLFDLMQEKVTLENNTQAAENEIDECPFTQSQLDQANNELTTIDVNRKQKATQLQEQLDDLTRQEIAEVDKDSVQLQSVRTTNISKVRQINEKRKEDINKKLKDIYEKMSEVDRKYDVSLFHKDHNDFIKEKQKETNFVNNEIQKLDQQYNTVELEIELNNRLRVLDTNSQTLKDEAAKLKEEASSIKSKIVEKESVIKEDEEKLSQPVPICSKCLRPFGFQDTALNVIKNTVLQARKEIEVLNSRLEQLKNQMEPLKVKFEEISKLKFKTELDYKDKIKAVVDKKNQESEILIRKRDLIQSEIVDNKNKTDQKIQDILSKKEIESSGLEVIKKSFESNINEINKYIESEIYDIEQKYTIDVNKIKSEHNKKFTHLRSEMQQKSQTQITKLIKQYDELWKKISELNEFKTIVEKLCKDRDACKVKLESINKRILECHQFKYDDNQIKKIVLEIQDHENKLVILIEEKKSLTRELNILEFWKESFSDSGIKSMLIDMAIPHMNEAVSMALERAAPGVYTVSFDTLKATKSGDMRDKFNVNVLHNLKGTDSFKMLSGGEQRLVDLCCMDALDSLAERLYGKRFHNKFYDEALDSLDDDSVQIFGQISKTLSSDKNITLITHKAYDSIEPDRVFTF